MKRTTAKLFLGDLLGCKIITAEGKVLGHVLDIQLTSGPEYKVTALMFGRGGLFHRLHVLNPFHKERRKPARPDTVPWEAVASFARPVVKLKPGFAVGVQEGSAYLLRGKRGTH